MSQPDTHIDIAIVALRTACNGAYQPQRFDAIAFSLLVLVFAQHFNNFFRTLHAVLDASVRINIPQKYFFRLAHASNGGTKGLFSRRNGSHITLHRTATAGLQARRWVGSQATKLARGCAAGETGEAHVVVQAQTAVGGDVVERQAQAFLLCVAG